MKRILFIGLPDNIHTARWINQLHGQGWDIHLFASYYADLHPAFHDLTVYGARMSAARRRAQHIRLRGGLWPLPRGADRPMRMLPFTDAKWRERETYLAWIIKRLKPDIIHSLVLQESGYLTYGARQMIGARFPKWIVANWGSDIYLFGRLPDHAERIRAMLKCCDGYSCESQRDLDLGRAFGFSGKSFPIVSIAGGMDLEAARALQQEGPTSSRRVVALKGYQNWAGRALTGLQALRLCVGQLRGYRVAIYLSDKAVQIAARLFSLETGIPVDFIRHGPHAEILRLHGHSRVSIGLSISDGASNSFLEALAMGSFPIQSNTSTADEWIQDGETGILVPPEDPAPIAAAVRRALTDDALVDRAAARNAATAASRLEYRAVQAQVVAAYKSFLQE